MKKMCPRECMYDVQVIHISLPKKKTCDNMNGIKINIQGEQIRTFFFFVIEIKSS